MPGNPHPAAAPYNNRSATDIIAFIKLRERLGVANADEIRNTDFTGQFGGLFVRSTQARYDLDTGSDAPEDGDDVIIDAAGNHFIRKSEGTSIIHRVYTDADVSAGEIAIEEATDRALIDVSSAVVLNLPSVASRGDRDLMIKDISGAAAGNNITLNFSGAETCDGQPGSAFVIVSNYGWINLMPGADWHQNGGVL